MKCIYCSQQENLDDVNKGGWTALMYASYIGHELVVLQLLEAGVSVNSTNNKGQSPLALATSCGNDKTAELLIKVVSFYIYKCYCSENKIHISSSM